MSSLLPSYVVSNTHVNICQQDNIFTHESHVSVSHVNLSHVNLSHLPLQAAMTYAQAQLRIDDTSQQDDISISLRTLNMLAKQLKQRRKIQGLVAGVRGLYMGLR